MGKQHYFVNIKVVYPESGKIWIDKPTYTMKVLKKFQMENSKPTIIPSDAGEKLSDKEVYQSAIWSLQYLSTRTRSDVAYAVGIVARFCLQPTKEHWTAVRHILWYLNGTRNYGLLYSSGETSYLTGYSDADWTGDINDYESTTGYLF